ncbi:IclR family transcriptional regulator [Bacillus sp. AFS076308]|uniref:IclR family transcriptional regulator n=1 Tax=unclassified Bacillus (in: firmicutes) TaxID=185979 RepID=UPI000BF7D871|nr:MULTISPECIES: IclR family transcriptional regulator [unclassified Bacillus (in: firmicutes)]PFN97735.1 IclR family transcriptional regulator [Bacillus sp. AFS076308]PGV51071.1 IclR family transcriptional regulator [Bacillus sp. AFS037270]
MSVNVEKDSHLSSVKNALRILQCFTMDEPEKKISELSAALGLNKSTVSRTMTTLASEGFVYKDPETKKYRLGLSILSLSGIVSSQMDIYRESQPVLNRLVENIGETAHISVLDHLDVIYLQKVECNHPVRFLTHIGKRNPPYCTSSGKVLLAYAAEDVVNQVIEKGLEKLAKNTITNPQNLRIHLNQVKENGYANSTEEILEGVTSIAAPIFDYRGKVIAALSVVGPNQRIQEHKIQGLAKKVMSAAREVSTRMGYRG